MLRRPLFILGHQAADRAFYSTYRSLITNQWKPYATLKEDQEAQLRHLVRYVYEQVPYYRTLMKGLDLFPRDIRTIEDLEKFPVLTKETIKQHWDELMPGDLSRQRFDSRATGGSTGTPMQFRVLKYDRTLGGCLLYRGWGYGGFQLGDRMVILAGSSLDVGKKPWIQKRGHEVTRNIRKLSSVDMGEAEMREYADILTSFSPRFMRGYASSIFYFTRWIAENDVRVPALDAVYTTAEKLFPHMRKTIGDVFECPVFDNYGMNDGGVSAYECPEHSGLHIDTERSIMEIVDGDHRQVSEGEGMVLATSLYNYAMPFIRYAPGDLATLSGEECSCGRPYLLLKEVVGREKEFLVTPTGRAVHGAAFIGLIYILLESSAFPGMVNRIRQYQIVQRQRDSIILRLVCDEPLPDALLDYLRNLVSARFDGWAMEFEFPDRIEETQAGKYKFIINEMVDR